MSLYRLVTVVTVGLLTLQSTLSSPDIPSLKITPPEVVDLWEGQSIDVELIFVNCLNNNTLRNVTITYKEGDEGNVVFPGHVYNIPCETVDSYGNMSEGKTLRLTSKLVSFVELQITDDGHSDVVLQTYSIGIIREPDRVIDKVFLYGIIVMSIFNTMCFGISLDLDKVKEFFKKPIDPSIGVVCQFIGMPLIAFALSQIITQHASTKLGVFTAGVAPGGGASNIWCYLLGGDVDLSITMTFISSTLALAFIPFWMYTLGKYIIGDEEIDLPIVNMITTLLIIVIPVAVGLLINKFLPERARIILKAQKIVIGITVIYAIVMGTVSNIYAFKIIFGNYELALCGLLLPYVGGVVGFVTALLLRRPRESAITIGIETAVQNTSIATILLRTSLSQPWADISTATPIILNLFTPIPFQILFAIRMIYLKCCQKNQDSKDIKTEDGKESGKAEMEVVDVKLTTL